MDNPSKILLIILMVITLAFAYIFWNSGYYITQYHDAKTALERMDERR